MKLIDYLFCCMVFICTSMLTGCEEPKQREITFGDVFTMKSGFYKGCHGYASAIYGDEVMLSDFTCALDKTTQVIYLAKWVKIEDLQ